ncbi:MAG: PD40 domain-containing protein [Deltaproteobacteria bacterium]|nr:PD40 domain-containing protein [Deltaproteobacteria bacterium]
MRARGGLALVVVAGCGAQLGGGGGLDGGDNPLADADLVAPPDAPADAAPLGPFGTPRKLGAASAANAAEDDPTLSSTGLELVFARVDPNDGNRKHLFYAQRASTADDFTTATRLPFDLNGKTEQTPRFSADDKTLYFATDRAPSVGNLDIYAVAHPAPGNNWGTPAPVAGVNTAGVDKWFMPCGTQGRYLVIQGTNLAEGTLGAGTATVVAELNGATGTETGTFLTQDCLTIYFASDRSGKTLLYTSTRTSVAAPWATPTVFADFAALGGDQQDPYLSPDGRTFVFVSDVGGTNDCYIATR